MTLFNADDYGITLEQSRHILECRAQGVLTGVSLMPNSPCLTESAALLAEHPGLLTAVHLNLTEGLCVSEPAALALLVSPDGRFRRSFAELLFLSLGPRRAELKRQIKRELAAQIERVLPLTEGRGFRLDGHQHVQMIPLVMKTLAELSEETGRRPEYIRFSLEPLAPYIGRRVRFVNLVKNRVLALLSVFDRPVMRRLGLRPGTVMGLMFSGNMDFGAVSAVLPKLERLAKRKGRMLEVVTHPGWGIAEGESLDVPDGLFDRFERSRGRKTEYDCLIQLK